MKKNKIEIGDVFEIITSKGKAYLQYVKAPKDQNEVEKIKVFYLLHKSRPNNLEDVLKGDFFYLSFILKAAYKEGIVERVGNYQLPDNFEYPKYFRDEHLFKEDYWQIVDAETWGRESVKDLNEEQKKLSPWGTWNDTLLIENLENGWRLENWI